MDVIRKTSAVFGETEDGNVPVHQLKLARVVAKQILIFLTQNLNRDSSE